MNKLRFVTYSSSGSSLGGYYEVEYDGVKKTVRLSEQKTHSDPEQVKTTKVGIDCGKAIRKIIEKYDMLKWADLPPSEIMVLDAATVSLSIRFENGEVYNISETQALPENGMTAICEVRECMLSFMEA